VSGEVDAENRKVARIVDGVFGGNSRMSSYPDLDEQRRIKHAEPARTERPDLVLHHRTLRFHEILAVSEREEFARVLVATGLYAIAHGPSTV